MKRGPGGSVLIRSLFVLLLASAAVAQSGDIHQQIRQTYNFQPHLLSSQEITAKSAVLDNFWTKAKAQPAVYIPALRQELADFNHPPFFLYDGSMLLLELSDTAPDRKIALSAMARCDLRDLKFKDYFMQVHRLAAMGEDTTVAAFHILELPKFSVFIPLHVLTLGQNYSLIYMLLPTDQNFWQQAAIDRLKTEKDETAQKSLLMLLWYAQTDTADQAISAFDGDVGKPSASRAYTQDLLHRKEKIDLLERAKAAATTEASLRQKRRERLSAVSDEALYDLDDYTFMLMAKRK